MTETAIRVRDDGLLALPHSVTDELGLKPGDEVTVRTDGQQAVIQRKQDAEAFIQWLDSVAGCVDLGGKTTDEWLDEIRPHRLDPD